MFVFKVSCQVRSGCKVHTTHVTLVGPCTCVGVHVLSTCMAPAESLSTYFHRTSVRLYPSVYSLVFLQVIYAKERPVAYITDEAF